jgi:chemosensory pili system protein ChpA (sensor histidine kinase/response regulator)
LDVVRSTLNEVGGAIEISSIAGYGTQFKISVPSDISTMPVIPVVAGGYTAMIPASIIDRVVVVTYQEAEAAAAEGTIRVNGVVCDYVDLIDRLGDVAIRSSVRTAAVQLVIAGAAAAGATNAKPTAFRVDRLEGRRKVLVRPLGRSIARLSGIIAGTIYGDGTPCMIINPLRMQSLGTAARVEEVLTSPRVMVVDDSPTVRAVAAHFLRKHGYEPLVAQDGEEAVSMIKKGDRPAVFLLDVEMPKMNGFELARFIRATPEISDTPIIMVTSRTAKKHRETAANIGVDAYLGKPYEETALLKSIGLLLARGTRVAA